MTYEKDTYYSNFTTTESRGIYEDSKTGSPPQNQIFSDVYKRQEQKEHVQKARIQVLQDRMEEREKKTVSLETQITQSQETVLQYMESLNGIGQAEAIRLVELLTKIPEYKKERR